MNEESQTQGPNATAGEEAARRRAAAVRGRFELLAELGSGSSGTVHRARLLRPYLDLPEGAEVAIKFLRSDLPDIAKARERFYAEGEIGSRLRHPNLAAIHGVETVTVEDAGERHEVTLLVMQFVDGKTLRSFLADGERPVEDLVRRLGADAAAGLHALHRHGLVHRDVKPENLILTPERKLKIVDLGLVRPFGMPGPGSGSTSSGWGLAGSVAYAAPESFGGERSGPRSDLYSLGVVLYELATGRHPFTGQHTADEMIDAHLHRPVPPPAHLRPGISPLLAQLLLDMLQKRPDDRPRDATEVQRILLQGERSEWWRRLEASEPVRASRRRLMRLRRPADTPFFGRRRELDLLEARLESARRGRGAAIIVTGPHGSGRRRLCDHAMSLWLRGEHPPLLLGGEADRGLGHAEPFAGSLLDLLLRGEGPDSPQAGARIAAAAAGLGMASGDDAEALAAVVLGRSTEDPEVRATRLTRALLALPTKRQPLVIRIDHAERLDTSGRLVLRRLLASLGESPILIVLTGDREPIPMPDADRIELGGLDLRDFSSFARALFRDRKVGDEFVNRAHQTVCGVPGNLVEALEHLVQEGLLRGQPGDYHDLREGEFRPAPDHLQRFRRRIEELGAETRDVLHAAAILGTRCRLDDLLALVGRDEVAVLEDLSAFRGRILRALGGEIWFRHRDFHRVLLDSVPPTERRRLHLRAAEILAARGAPRLEVGMHRSQALDHRGCLEPLLDGLEELVGAASRRTALRIANRLTIHFDHLEHADDLDELRLRFHLLHAAARRNAGQPDAAVQAWREAEALARELDDVVASAEARTGIADSELSAGHLMAAIAILEGVHDDLEEAPGTRADRAAAAAHAVHGRILLYRGQAAEGHRHVQAALRRLPPDDEELEAHLRIDLARLEALQHHYPTARKTLRRVARGASAKSLPRVRLRLHLYRGQIRTLLGDEEAAQDLREALDEAERLGLSSYAARASLFLGERQFWRGNDGEARRWFARARERAVRVTDRLAETMSRAYLFGLGGDDENLGEAVERLGLPEVTATWLLARAARGELTPGDREVLAALIERTSLPLPPHLRILRFFERQASARSLVRGIASRLPDRRTRRHFLATWPASARI